ncbi:MAG: protein translocase subunit SecF [bacterium]
MIDLIKYRKWWYLLSLIIIIPGTLSLIFWGLKPSIDFTGGTQIEFSGTQNKSAIESIAKQDQMTDVVVSTTSSGIILKTKTISEPKTKNLIKDVEAKVSGAKEVRVDTVGPSISSEITRNAFILILAASLVIVIYIAYSFRKVPKPANSFEFGIAAIIALLHDVLVVLGVFSLLGHFYGVEVDPLFITAVLTVIGFSVHDTIVIFDRIRENLIKGSYKNFEQTVAVSVFEMLPRTLNTSFLVWVILLVLFMFGGVTIRYFVLALLVGILSGTFSSILNASPLLVTWQDFKNRKIK